MNAPLAALAQEKIVHERIMAVLADTDLLRIGGEFGARVFRRSSLFHGLESFLVQNSVQGKHCLEIGTCNGVTAVILSRFFERVTTIDVAPSAIKRKVAQLCGATNIDFVDVAENTIKAIAVKPLDFDFAYLDGDHARDTATDFALVQRCGRVLFHEAWDIQPPVNDLVNALPPDQVTRGGVCFALWERS